MYDYPMLRQQLAVVAARHPHLTANGWRDRKDDGHFRTELTDPSEDTLRQFATAVAFLAAVGSRKTMNYQRNSYGYKHDAEKWGAASGMEPYVSNGVLIAAADHLGLEILDGYSLNVHLNLRSTKATMRAAGAR